MSEDASSKEQLNSAFSDRALQGRVTLKEGEISLREALRRLEIPLYGVAAAGARVVGWGYDIYQALHGRIVDPDVIATSTMIKYAPVIAMGAVYYGDDSSHAWTKAASIHAQSQYLSCMTQEFIREARRDPSSNIVEPIEGGLRDGVELLKSSWNRLQETSSEDTPVLERAKKIFVGGLKFGADFAYRSARFGYNIVAGTVRYGWESGGEAVEIGSKVWFVRRSIRRITPILQTVEGFIDPRVELVLPKEFERFGLYANSYNDLPIRRIIII